MAVEEFFEEYGNLLRLIDYPSKRPELEYAQLGKTFFDFFIKRYEEEKKRKVNEILEKVRNSNKSFFSFFYHIEEVWKNYLSLLSNMSLLAHNLQFLYYEKTALLLDLVESTFNLNVHLYFLTDIEKEIYEYFLEKLPEKRRDKLVSSIKSFPTYFRGLLAESLKGKDIDLLPNIYVSSSILSNSKSDNPLTRYFNPLQSSFYELLSSFIPKGSFNYRPSPNEYEFRPKNKLEKILHKLILYDHFFELFLRDSGILRTDLKFYIDLCDRLSCKRDYTSLIGALENYLKNLDKKFLPSFKKYFQTKDSCGATCLINAFSIYFPGFYPNNHLEKAVLDKITAKNFPNNIPSSIVYVARRYFGLPAFFFAKMDSFKKLFLDRSSENEAIRKFQKDFVKIKDSVKDYSSFSPDMFINSLRKGILISYVSGNYPQLHYKMVVGYNLKKGVMFYVFDPLMGISIISWEELSRDLWNGVGVWGVEFHPPESTLFPRIRELTSIAKNLLKWKP